MDRRHFLATVAALSTAGVAGCTGDGGETPTDTATATETATLTETAAPTETATATATDTQTVTATTTDTPMRTDTATATATPTDAARQVVDVAPGRFAFDPDSFEISVGTTVEWVWQGGGHNIVVDAKPADSEWSGTEGGAGTTYGEGHTHTDTFEVPGTYEYHCAPHESFGMVGSFEVVE